MQTSFSSCSAFYVAFLPLSSVWRGDGSRERREREVWWGKGTERKRQKRDRATETESRIQIRIVWKHPVFQ